WQSPFWVNSRLPSARSSADCAMAAGAITVGTMARRLATKAKAAAGRFMLAPLLLLAVLAADATLRRQRENDGKTLCCIRPACPAPACHGGRAGLAARHHLGPQARRGRRGAAVAGRVPGLCLRLKWRGAAGPTRRLARLRALPRRAGWAAR